MLKLHRYPSGIYRLRGTHYGVAVDRSLGTRSREEAQALLIAEERAIFARVHGIDLEGTPLAPPGWTFADAALDWVRSGGRTELYFYFDRVVSALADDRLSEITQGRLDRVAMSLFPTQAPSTVNRGYYALVSVIFGHAAAERMMVPFRVRKRRVPDRLPRFESPERITALLAAADDRDPTLAAWVAFLVGTGARTGEAFGLHPSRIARDRTRVAFETTKTRRSRSVAVPRQARDRLPECLNGTHVFTDAAGKPYSRTDDGRYYGPRTRLKRLCRDAGLPHVSPHTLRHTFATWHWHLHKDLLKLQAAGGWQTLAMVTNYAHLGGHDLRARIVDAGWEDLGSDAEDGRNPGAFISVAS